MRKRLLRALLGAGYVCLLTALLLYQAEVFGGRGEWQTAVLGTLILGVALAVVLVLYLRVNDRLSQAEENPGVGHVEKERSVGTDGILPEADGERSASAGKDSRIESDNPFAGEDRPATPRSYEEIYAQFLSIMETCALSERELEVAWLLYRGYTNRQIGEELYIAETTVKKHVSHIYQKMDVCSRKEFRAMVQGSAWERSRPGG